jgi:uncharacterized protein (TIGR03435 family)
MFETVSIKPNVARTTAPPIVTPDGGLRLTGVPIQGLIARAYPEEAVGIVGLPGWAGTDRYDLATTSTLREATPDDVLAMLRHMLAERLKLSVHIEQRDRDGYDLIAARKDGRLGPGMKPTDADCENYVAPQQPAGPVLPPPGGRLATGDAPPPCRLRVVPDEAGGNRLEGDTTLANLAVMLRSATGQPVVDHTALEDYYHVKMRFDMMASRRGPDVAPAPGGAPLVFTAVQEQLGLKLVPAEAKQSILVIDHIERPTPN